ncbi:MAG TPA: deaminase [Alphaproteobacteria bacterium]
MLTPPVITVTNSADTSQWHSRFLELAAHVAQWSRDPSKKVGAVIVRPDKTIASLGFNGFARGVIDAPERYADKALKNEMVVHAEMNAILHAREPLHDYTLYVWPYHPCSRCAATIIQSGIKTIYSFAGETENWKATIDLAQSMFREAGVKIVILDDPEITKAYDANSGMKISG